MEDKAAIWTFFFTARTKQYTQLNIYAYDIYALIMAAARGHLQVVQYLAGECGASVDAAHFFLQQGQGSAKLLEAFSEEAKLQCSDNTGHRFSDITR